MSDSSIRVLLVCLGNICRSPMAEGVMKMHVEEMGLSHRFFVDSAGTAGYHAGEMADRRTMTVLEREGAPRPSLSRRVDDADFERFDWILAMDEANLRDLQNRAPSDNQARIALALEPVGGGEVPDPYYGGPAGFETVFQLLDGSMKMWIKRMCEG